MAVQRKIDNIDKRILKALQRNGRLHNNELAQEIGLSNSACLRRVDLLEKSGIIENYVAILNPKQLNCNIIVYVLGSFFEADPTKLERFIFEVKLIPQIIECYLMAGDFDFVMKIMVSSLEEFNELKNTYLNKSIGIKNIKSEIMLKPIKNSTEIPI